MLETNRQQWEEWEIEFILNNYEKMTWKEIASKLNRTESSIQMKSKRLGIKKLPYYCDKNFFNVIDSEEKAYWLGFITADGCVTYGKNNSGELSIELSVKDIEHLKKFNKSINGNYNITIQDKQCKLNGSINTMCKIRIYSIDIVNGLNKHNVTPNKTKNIKLIKLDDNLMPHFIRGFFDGDGSIYIKNKNKEYIGMKFTSGCEDFINELRSYLLKQGIKSYIQKYENIDCYDLMIGGMKNVDNMLNYLYKDANIYLDRKIKKAISLYKRFKIEQRLPRHSEMSDFYFNWERKLES